jgi:hypothetical protein
MTVCASGLLTQALGGVTHCAEPREEMLSSRLVQLIEANWEEIAKRLIVSVRQHPEMPNLASKPEAELREWCRNNLADLDYLLAMSKEQEVKKRFEVLGRMRFEENVPLHEAVLRFHMLKGKIVGFIHEQGFPMSAMHLYAEEELELRIDRFFDDCVYHLVRGYERAMRIAQRAS